MNQAEVFAWFLANLIKWDEMFDSIRDEPEFQQIMRNEVLLGAKFAMPSYKPGRMTEKDPD